VLAKNQASPLAPESDEEKTASEKTASEKATSEKKEDAAPEDGDKDEKTADAKKKPAEVAVQIDFDNISQRILALPLPQRRYVGLQVGKTGVLFALEVSIPVPGTQAG